MGDPGTAAVAVVVLGADKGHRDRSRFDAAHELGSHGDGHAGIAHCAARSDPIASRAETESDEGPV